MLQQYLDNVTLDLVFLTLCIHETKVRNVQLRHFLLEI